MSNEFDDFSNSIDNITVERKRPSFKLYQLKLEHFHFNSGEIDVDMPISTSIELVSNYNYENDKLEWKKIISHKYYSLNDINKIENDTYEEKISNISDTVKSLEKIDLRKLNNNYFTEKSPERFTHWEISYNNNFKIVGTYDQTFEEFDKISTLLDLKNIIDSEVEKLKNKRINQ